MTPPTSTEILITRTFDAPPAVVFEAWTQAEHVRHWWDPGGIPLSSCHIDLRPGGSFRWVNNVCGEEHVFAGEYRQIAAPERLVFSVEILPSSIEALTTLTFTPEGSGTRLTMTIECASVEDRDALLRMRIDAGTGQTLDNLAAWLDRAEKSL